MRKMQSRCLALLFFAASLLPAFGVERIRIEQPLVTPSTAEVRRSVDELMEKVSALSRRLSGQTFEMVSADSKERAGYSLGVTASLGEESPVLVLVLKRLSDGAQSPAYPWLGPLTPELPTLLARAMPLLWGSLEGFPQKAGSVPPVVVDELPVTLLSPYGYPWSVAVKKDGNLLLAFGVGCAELDRAFRIVDLPGSVLADKGVLNYGLGVSVTPADAIVLKPAQGRDFYRLTPGANTPQKIPAGFDIAVAPFAALSDGSLLVLDSAAHKALRLRAGKRQEIPLFASKDEYISWFGTGPDGSIWIYDYILKGFRVYTQEGVLVDFMIPLVDPTHPLSPSAIAIDQDGSSVVFSSGQLLRLAPDGSVVWRLESLGGVENDRLPATGSVAVDWSRGLIYLTDTTGRRMIKLLDRAYSQQKGIKNEMEEKLIALRAKLASDEPGTFSDIARLYEAAGSPLMAKAYWQKVQETDPGNQDAEARLTAIEVEELKAGARDLDAKARLTLATIGIETARPLSQQAIQKYEQILSKAPDDAETRKAMADLKSLFSDTGQEQDKRKPLTISDLRIANLFPSLMQWYASHPAGSVTVKNTLSEPVEKVRASFFIPRFMDLPVESKTVAKLAPGDSVTFDLAPAFSQSVLELQEDMTAQAQVVVTWVAGGVEQTVSKAGAATIYRNSALTWDDTRKISSFITPNEATVSGFAARVIAAASDTRQLFLSRKIFQAMRICDAVGAYGITYVEDPDSPFSRALGKAEVVDTVRFPRTTLNNRTGDCDDTTALLSSLLESVGIRTAVLTSPGHVFLAFDSGEPAENAIFLSGAALEVIAREGSAWIPVETTVLSKGFMAAWASASELVKKYAKEGPFEFIAVARMRDSFPALPLAPSSIAVAEPATSSVDRAYSGSLSGFTSTLYTGRIKEMESSLATLSGKQAVKVRVQEGILHALFGKLPDAETAFRKAIAEDPSLVSPYVNLANVRLLTKDGDGALQAVKQGLAKNRDSALLNLLAARIYADKGDAANSAASFALVKKAAPELAARYPDLAPAGDTGVAAGTAVGAAQRGAQAGETSSAIWAGDQ